MPPRCQLLSGSLAIPSRLLRSPRSTHRTFATSNPLYRAKGGDLGSHLPKHVIPQDAVIPEYPHGAAMLFKQSNKGLYGGQRIQFGNNVSSDTETHTRRHWKPNILTKSLYSVALKKRIKLRITSKVLKTMDREGGLDEYLLKESDTRIKELGPMGWALRWTLMQTPEVIARLRAKAAAIGLAQDIIDQQWPEVPAYRKQAREARAQRREAEKQQMSEQESAQKDKEALGKRLRQRAAFRTRFTKEILSDRLAPTEKAALVMARHDTTRAFHLMNLLGGERAVLAYRRAEKSGEVEKAGGKEAWLARYKAQKMLKREEYQRRHQQALSESVDSAVEQAKRAEEGVKDAWGELIKKNNAGSSVRANA